MERPTSRPRSVKSLVKTIVFCYNSTVHETFHGQKIQPVESYRALLPPNYPGADHIRRGATEFLRVSKNIGGYENLDPELAVPLTAIGAILPKFETDSHHDYYQLPLDAISLSGFLNSTLVDSRREQKRELVFGRILEGFDSLASRGIAIEKYDGFTRYDLCLGDRLRPIILPLGTMIYETDEQTALEKNVQSYRELLTNILSAADPEEVEFFKQLREQTDWVL